MSQVTKTKWWGWGDPDAAFRLDEHPNFWPYLEARLELAGHTGTPVPGAAAIPLPDSKVNTYALGQFAAILGRRQMSKLPMERLSHAVGKSYADLVRLRLGQLGRVPDLVLFPQTREQVEQLVIVAAHYGVHVIPFGGGTSVVGGVEVKEPAPEGAVSLDLRQLDRVLEIDAESGLARVEPGLMGPALERQLNARGLTLGHYPQSFEFSTVGGWVATRSAGQASSKYGNISELVAGLAVATPVGTLSLKPAPATATGPDLRQLLVGSEGALGVIVETTLRVHPMPGASAYRGVLFPGFEAGVAALRAIRQAGWTPAVLRLSDPQETEMLFKMRAPSESAGSRLKEMIGRKVLQLKKVELAGSCLLVLGCEGDPALVKPELAAALKACKHFGGTDLGASIGERWHAGRFELPYLRDVLLDRGVLVDTLETACPWAALPALRERVGEAIAGTLQEQGTPGIVACHVSHVYPDGASLYFTVLARQDTGRELEQWQAVKAAATDAILDGGGTLSHHHGVGADHAPWLERELGEGALDTLRALKAQLDPRHVMNPGKLGL